MNFDRLSRDLRRWGWFRCIFMRMMWHLEQQAGVHVYRVFVRALTRRDPGPDLPDGISLRMVQPAELFKAAEDPGLELSPDFVRGALARGDQSFGAFDRDRLVTYTWRTFTAAPHTDGLWAKVNPPYRYAYKGFTRASHRGRHLQSAVSHFSDAYVMERGYTHHMDIAEVSNFAALTLARNKGARAIGYAGYVKWFGRCRMFRTPAVKRVGFEFFPATESPLFPSAEAKGRVPAVRLRVE